MTGVARPPIPVPHHDRYNPVTNAMSNAGREMMTSSRRSAAPPSSRRTQVSGGILPVWKKENIIYIKRKEL